MSEPQITYPSGLPWGKVEGRIARAYADAKDVGALPDITPATANMSNGQRITTTWFART